VSIITLRPQDYQFSGSSIELSAYDIPREVEGIYDQQTGVFHIKFAYLDDEESVSRDLDGKLRIKVGKPSGKIFGFDLKVSKYEFNRVIPTRQQAIDMEIHRPRPFNQKANLKVIQFILDRQKAYIFADLA
jgi:hypothetical protein